MNLLINPCESEIEWAPVSPPVWLSLQFIFLPAKLHNPSSNRRYRCITKSTFLPTSPCSADMECKAPLPAEIPEEDFNSIGQLQPIPSQRILIYGEVER